MKIRNNIKTKKDLKMNRSKIIKNLVSKKLDWEAIGLANSINKNYHNWLSCVTDKFGHGFGVFSGTKYFRIALVSGNSIIDQKNSKLYKTVHKDNHLWGYIVKQNSENHKRGDILTNNYKVVGNVLTGHRANLGMPNSHYPNYTECWAGSECW